MKIIPIGDIHGRPIWKKIVEQEYDADLFVFVGDYFDSFGYSTVEQIHNFREIIKFKKANPEKVILLIGNHDAQYMPRSFDPFIEGFNIVNHATIQALLVENNKYLIMCFQIDNYLFTHAGVSEMFLKNTGYPGPDFNDIPAHLNSLWRMNPEEFKFKPGSREGNIPENGCTWIRPQALMSMNKKLKKSGLIQIVGHTHQNQIDIKGKATGGRYFFIDTLGTSGEYLVIENNTFTAKKIQDESENI